MTNGPAKGSGGRPRLKAGSTLKSGDNKGYTKVTTGPPGKGTQRYQHRVKAGVGKGSKTGGSVVHHKSGSKSSNSRSNLEVTTRKAHPTKHAK